MPAHALHDLPTRAQSAARVREAEAGRRALLQALVIAALPPILVACRDRTPIRGHPVAPGSTVLALGDSLTHGSGAGAEQASYPAVLARLTGSQVNAGVPGDTTAQAQALARSPSLQEAHRPALALLGIGGNDILRRMRESMVRSNLRRICELVRGSDAQLLLIAVPRPTLAAKFTGSLADHPMYGKLAEALRVPLHRRGWVEVLGDERLKSDAFHANAARYEQFARGPVATARASG